MPAFSKGLETVLHTALELANVRKHEFATLEHLLLALTEDQDAKAVIDACNVDMKLLRDNLMGYIDNDELKKIGMKMSNNTYGQYLLKIVSENRE